MPFNEAWAVIQGELFVGDHIQNWTAHSGLLGDSLTISVVTPEQITVEAPGARNLQKIPVCDFEDVYNIWDRYIHGITPRGHLRDYLTRYSKYIISIFHWLENERGGQLP